MGPRLWDLFKGVPELRATVEKQLRRQATAHARKEVNARKKIVGRLNLPALESLEQQRLIEECVRRGWLVRKLTCAGHRGFPDLYVADRVSKRASFIELKVPGRSYKASPAQKRMVEQLQDCGQRAYVAWGKADALDYLERAFDVYK